MRYSITKTLALLILGAAFLAGFSPALQAAEDSGDSVLFSTDEGSSLSGIEMEDNRGAFGINTLTADQDLAASTSGNSLNVGGNLANGQIALGDNMSGFGSYVMNTGNNSTINSAVALTVQLAPAQP